MTSVSIIIPCYHYGRFLRECVESVLSQTGVEVQVLIIDDASTDNTLEVATDLATRDSRVEVRRHTWNQGHIATYNEGLEWASGDYTLLLSADDMLVPGSLVRATAVMEAHPEIGFVYGNAIHLIANQVVPRPRSVTTECGCRIHRGLEWLANRCIIGDNPAPTPTVVVRTRLQQRLGGYREDLPDLADMEMWMRFSIFGDVGEIIDADQAYYRIHGENMHIFSFRKRRFMLEQRRTAIFDLIDAHSRLIPDAYRLRHAASRRIARDALGWAGTALDTGDEPSYCITELREFALTVYDGARYTPEYLGLCARMLIGPDRWSVVRKVRDWCAQRRSSYKMGG